MMQDEIPYKSKTKKKKEAEALQRLGLELNKLSIPQLERIEIPENLRTALIAGKSITSNVAGRRHRQFIGALMRDVDPETVRTALRKAEDEAPVEFKDAREIRMRIDSLLTGDPAAIETLLGEFPRLERQRLRQLVRNIKNEKSGSKISKSRKALEQLIMTEMRSN